MPMTKFQRQVHEKDRALLELELDDETLDAFVEVVESLAMNSRCRQKRVALIAQNRQPLVQGAGAVLALVDGVVAESASDHLGLVDATCPDRTGVDLDEADDV